MALEIPGYIEASDIVGSLLDYEWDPKRSAHHYQHDNRLANRIGRISIRGVVALSAGFVEWVAWRLKAESDHSIVFDYLEAVYAGVVDWRYVKVAKAIPEVMSFLRSDIPDKLGPLKKGVAYLDEVVRGAQSSGKIGLSSSCLAQLALSINPAPDVYKKWRRAIIQRLQKQCPRDSDSPLGIPVAREVLDPGFECTQDEMNGLIAQFINGLDYKANPCLQPPDAMSQSGFEGTPYEY